MIATLALCKYLMSDLRPNYADQSVPSRYKGNLVLNKPHGFKEKVVALTFDDGPTPKVTPKVLQALKDADAKATFFVLGSLADTHPELVKQEVDAGHVVGSHTWSHKARPVREAAGPEIHKTARAIYNATGQWPSMFRPPYGIQDSWTTKISRNSGYGTVLWNKLGPDSVKKPDAVLIAKQVLDTIKPGDIFLFHDGPGKEATALALPTILKKLKAAGYKFVTVSELTKKWDTQIAANEAKQRQAKAKPTKGHG